jgi:predicted dinucleotide-binding enzyme
VAESITLDELLAACKDAGIGEEGAVGSTLAELMAAWKCGVRVANSRLHAAKAAGVLRTGHRRSVDITGRNCRVPVYWLEVKKKGKR